MQLFDLTIRFIWYILYRCGQIFRRYYVRRYTWTWFSHPWVKKIPFSCCVWFISEDAFQKWKIVFSVRLTASENRSRVYYTFCFCQIERSSSSFRRSSDSSDFLQKMKDRKSHMTTRLLTKTASTTTAYLQTCCQRTSGQNKMQLILFDIFL